MSWLVKRRSDDRLTSGVWPKLELLQHMPLLHQRFPHAPAARPAFHSLSRAATDPRIGAIFYDAGNHFCALVTYLAELPAAAGLDRLTRVCTSATVIGLYTG